LESSETGKVSFGSLKRDHIVVGGIRQLRFRVWASRKPAVIRLQEVRQSKRVDNRKGASGLERGTAIPVRGRLRRAGGRLGMAAARNKAVELVRAKNR